MKPIKAIYFFCTLFCLLLMSCAPKQKPVLRVGTGAEYPPFNYLSGDQFMGIDVDISRRIAEKLGMEIQFTKYDFLPMFSALASNKIDIAVSALTITEERQKSMDFTIPYFVANQVLIAKRDSPIQINILEDIGKYKIGTLNNTTGHIYLIKNLLEKDLMDKQNLKLFPTNLDGINELMSGNLDFVMIDDTAANGYSKQIPIKIAYTIRTNEEYGIAMQRGKDLNEKINKALKQMLDSGEVQSIIDKHMKQ